MGVPQLRDCQSGLPSADSTSSYWHRAPEPRLVNHRTTERLPTDADVIIVGSGITGAFAARFLKDGIARVGRVVMLEAREACWGATGRNGGHCQPNVYAQAPDVAAFELRNFDYLKRHVQKHNVACDWHDTTGTHGFFSKPLFSQAEAHWSKVTAQDPTLGSAAKVVTTTSTSPSLSDLAVPRAVGAMWQASAASLWPYRLVARLLCDLLDEFGRPSQGNDAEGFNLQTNTPVTHIEKAQIDGSGSKTSIWVVHTPRGQVVTRCVLLACNGYTSHLLPEFSDLIVPVRGQVAALNLRAGIPNPQLRHTYVFLAEKREGHHMDDYLVQRPRSDGGELIFGGGRDHSSAPTVGVSDDDVVDEATSLHLRSVLPEVLDVGGGGDGGGGGGSGNDRGTSRGPPAEATHEWTGIMGFSRDGHPWVGRVPETLGGGEGLWICAGYTGHGMPLATLCAKAVVGLMSGRDAEAIDLPRGFWISEERVRGARGLDEVKAADQKGIGLFPPLVDI